VNSRQSLTHRLWVSRLERICRSQSAILGYHGIASSSRREDLSLLLVSPSRFRTEIELLVDAGFKFVTVAEFAGLAAGGEPPPGYAAISFDDGMRNNLTTALPILEEYGVRATVYVTIGFIGGRSPWVGRNSDSRMLNEDELVELTRSGWELGAHTMTHPDLSTLDYGACLREIEESKSALERIGGVKVETFAYPFGRYGRAAVQATRDSGFTAAVAAGGGSWDPFKLKRSMIGAIDPMPVVLLKLVDRYEPLLQSPPLNLLRQVSRRARGRVQEGQRRA
jgi:peptidoglycan/xylan/chitin deacetylase (PgdA/CDA1 family)